MIIISQYPGFNISEGCHLRDGTIGFSLRPETHRRDLDHCW